MPLKKGKSKKVISSNIKVEPMVECHIIGRGD